MLLVCAAAGTACGSESGFEPERPAEPEGPLVPEPQPVFSILEVVPTHFALATVAPGNTVQLTVWAYDLAGAATARTGAAAYSSSAPRIAEVSSGGLVTASSPGTSEITVSLTLGGITRTASTTVTVQTRDYAGNAGVYDLSALITSFDDAWGYDLEGYRYTAALTLREGPGSRWLAGTYTDLKLIGPGGDSYDVADTGLVTGSVDLYGRVIIELLGDGNSIDVTLIPDTVAPGVIAGGFGCCGHISGSFTAERRQAE